MGFGTALNALIHTKISVGKSGWV